MSFGCKWCALGDCWVHGDNVESSWKPPDDWVCPKCGDLQFGRNEKCRICGEPNPQLQPTSWERKIKGKGEGKNYKKGWECDDCGYWNKGGTRVCGGCNSDPGFGPAGPKGGKGGGPKGWGSGGFSGNYEMDFDVINKGKGKGKWDRSSPYDDEGGKGGKDFDIEIAEEEVPRDQRGHMPRITPQQMAQLYAMMSQLVVADMANCQWCHRGDCYVHGDGPTKKKKNALPSCVQDLEPVTKEELEGFLAGTGVDEKASFRFRQLHPKLQRFVVQRCDLATSEIPSSALLGACNLAKGIREGDWLCLGCNDHQFARNEVCKRCSAPRPVRDSDWNAWKDDTEGEA